MALPTKPHHFVTKKVVIMILIFLSTVLIGITGYVTLLSKINSLSQKEHKQLACTQEAKQCADGSYVSRSGPYCDFAACPTAPVIFTTPTQADWQNYFMIQFPQTWTQKSQSVNDELASLELTNEDRSESISVSVIKSLNIPAGAETKTESIIIDGQQVQKSILPGDGTLPSREQIFIRKNGKDFYISAISKTNDFTEVDQILQTITFQN